MRYITIILGTLTIYLLASFNSYAQDQLDLDTFLNQRKAIHNVLEELEKEDSYYPSFLNEGQIKTSRKTSLHIFDLLMSKAYANGKEICFFGGWLSFKENGRCRPPWKFSATPQLKKFGTTYTKENYCGAKNLFRCNPVIYGRGTSEKGICITISSFNNVSATCAKASAEYSTIHYKRLYDDKKKVENFLRTSDQIVNFCRRKKNRYKGCKELLLLIKIKKSAICSNSLRESLKNQSINDLLKKVRKVVEKVPEVSKKKSPTVSVKTSAKKPVIKRVNGSTPLKLLSTEDNRTRVKLPKDGPGFTTKYNSYKGKKIYPKNNYYGTPGTIQRIKLAGEKLAKQGLTMSVTEISVKSGRTPGHSTHQHGRDLDIRLQRKDGDLSKACSITEPENEYQKCYDRGKTFKVIMAFVNTDRKSIKYMYINDSIIRGWINKELGRTVAKYWRGHHNHAHIGLRRQ